MDITKAVKHWQMDRRDNQGLLLEFLEPGTKKQIHPTKLGFNPHNGTSAEPFMVVFFNRLGNYESNSD